MPLTVIQGVRLFDGVRLHDDPASVTFDSTTGLIVSIGTGPSTQAEGATVIDGKGHTLLPGLIEAHVHVHGEHLHDHGGDHAGPESLRHMFHSGIKCGITTICDMFSDLEAVERYRGWLAQEKAEGGSVGDHVEVLPDLKTSLYGATIEGGWPKPIVLGRDPKPEVLERVSKWPNLTLDQVDEYVVTQKDGGADYIKLFQEDGCSLALPFAIPSPSPELQRAIIDAGHNLGLKCVGHATSLDSTRTLLEAGVDGLTHTFIDQPVTHEIVQIYKDRNAFVIPTLVVLASITAEEQEVREKTAALATNGGFIDETVKGFMTMSLGAKAEKARLQYAFDTIKRFKEEGIDVLAGTDSIPGLLGTAIGPGLWMELWFYVNRCGMTPVAALKAATSVTARRFGFSDRGIIEDGKRADLVLINGDPTQDIEAWKNIAQVWKGGVKAYVGKQ